jgi:hypothetical protein
MGKFGNFEEVSVAEGFEEASLIDALTMDNLVVGKADWLGIVGKTNEVLGDY